MTTPTQKKKVEKPSDSAVIVFVSETSDAGHP